MPTPSIKETISAHDEGEDLPRMSGDRELLELAAKAAGIEIGEHCDPIDRKYSDALGIWIQAGYGELGRWWNPLNNGDHALSLVSKLRLHIGMESFVANAWASDDYGNFQTVVLSHFGDDAALRRAIVKAAAHMAITPPTQTEGQSHGK